MRLDEIKENRMIDALVAGMTRSPRQLNRTHGSDAELLSLDNGTILAVSVDTVSDEVAGGIISDPEELGYFTVMAGMSDLAAVGAEPLGILIAATFRQRDDQACKDACMLGVKRALARLDTFLLGGDTNGGDALSLSATAIGLCRAGACRTREGAEPGDSLYSTGLFGAGNYLAFQRLLRGQRGCDLDTYPIKARLKEGRIIASLASAMIDTSDGFLASVDQLARINGCGFRLMHPPEELVTGKALAAVRQAGIPPAALLCAEHGEYELVFTIAPENEDALRAAAESNGFAIYPIGQATAECALTIDSRPDAPIDGAIIRNTLGGLRHDLKAYVAALVGFADGWR